MTTVTIDFEFSNENNEHNESEIFECEGDVLSAIDDYTDDRVAELGDGWDCDKWEIADWDTDYAEQSTPNDFTDLNDYADYCELVEQHGIAYVLRYEDIGDFDFDEQYSGEWHSEEDFARDLYEQCYDIPDHLDNYIDWERVASDVMMDYSAYDYGGYFYIFRD